MPSKSDDNVALLEGISGIGFAEELNEVVNLVHGGIPRNVSPDSLALVRILPGVLLKDWEKFASEHGLENWLGIHLRSGTAESVANLLALQERLVFQRDHDVLTGLGNRRLFNRRLAAEVERAVRTRMDLCLIYLDLDDFKRVNDTYGHLCGDSVLKRLGTILRDSLRRYDIPCRIGGEEFAIMLPATSCRTGVMLGNRILEFFRKETFVCDRKSFHVTFSAGVSSLNLLKKTQRTGEKLVHSADSALYSAKGKGKNRVLLAEQALAPAEGRDVPALRQKKQVLLSNGETE